MPPAEDSPVALVVAAHPDDGDFGAAGYCLQLIARGWAVDFVVCTNGAKGTEDRTMPRQRLIDMREAEQREACHRLGVRNVVFLGHEDSELVYSRQLLEQLVRIIRQLRPRAILTHDPTDIIIADSFINHADHRAAGTATLDAVYPIARDHLNFPEHLAAGLEPHKVRELFLWNSNYPNFDADITTVVDRKIHALTAHQSQFGNRKDFETFARESWKAPDGRYLERFRRINLPF